MNKKLGTLVLVAVLGILPTITFAQVMINSGGLGSASSGGGGGVFINCPPSSGTSLCNIIDDVIGYFNIALVLLMSFAVLAFTWYVIKYFIMADADKKEAGKYVMYSVIGFFVILSLWGIVNILSNTFGGLDNSFNSSRLRNIPLFPTSANRN